jgi:hypothetical protein
MVKKRGSVWDGIRDAYNLHQTIETLGELRQAGGKLLGELGEMAMMFAALAVVIGLFCLLR